MKNTAPPTGPPPAAGDTVSRETSGPPLVSQGTYALYRTPDGGMKLSVRPEGQQEDNHYDINPMMVTMIEAARRGEMPKPKDMLKLMRGGF